MLIGRDPQSGDLLFQSRNIESARIYGADLRYTQDLSAWRAALHGWSLDLAAYWAEGENRVSGAPLNSIAPPQAVAGITWTSADAAWDAGATLTHTAAKTAGDIDMSAEPRFATPGWTTVDLAAGWRPLDRLELRAGLFNLTGCLARSDWRQIESELERIYGLGSADGDPRWAPDALLPRDRDVVRDAGIGTVGGGNHFEVELQMVDELLDRRSAHAWGVRKGMVSIARAPRPHTRDSLS